MTAAGPVFRSGDLVFIATPNPLYRRVAAATGCPASHVGILFEDRRRGWVVAESAVPVCRYRALEEFLARSDHHWFAVRRLPRELSGEEVAALRRACDARMGRWYHLGFRYESHRTFCSKFVHEVYREALGVDVGEVETFGALLRRNPDEPLGFWRLWFFGRIPWQRKTITPASQLFSAALNTVFQSAPAVIPARR
ncbi:MAG: YiiX/YebB-like N1pC/P60 family cysteine hydrolase [Nevskia sp.]|nr:YiiX/YebB-like N1pC/P60 family cysteine hydrolase [Nevskia sp.]